MKKQLTRNIAILGLFLMLAGAGVQAQTPSRVEVKIPFDFNAGEATLKAGTYSIKRGAGNMLAIRSVDGKSSTLLNAPLTISSRDSKSGERLVFNKYGDQYYLSQVWLSVETGRQIFPRASEGRAAREYKIANGKKKPERIEVAVRRG